MRISIKILFIGTLCLLSMASATRRPLLQHASGFAPHEYIDQNGDLTGTVVELSRILSLQGGATFEEVLDTDFDTIWKAGSTDNGEWGQNMIHRAVDIGHNWGGTKRRELTLLTSIPDIVSEFYVLACKGTSAVIPGPCPADGASIGAGIIRFPGGFENGPICLAAADASINEYTVAVGAASNGALIADVIADPGSVGFMSIGRAIDNGLYIVEDFGGAGAKCSEGWGYIAPKDEGALIDVVNSALRKVTDAEYASVCCLGASKYAALPEAQKVTSFPTPASFAEAWFNLCFQSGTRDSVDGGPELANNFEFGDC